LVSVTLRRDDNQVCISITDDGPGIPAEEQERIFERFHRVKNSSSAGPVRSGLGLAIARGLVDLHDGRLWVESTPGYGSTFHVTLPIMD
jgi:signal transduction histidine kinase